METIYGKRVWLPTEIYTASRYQQERRKMKKRNEQGKSRSGQ
jgi:hypothetical protein